MSIVSSLPGADRIRRWLGYSKPEPAKPDLPPPTEPHTTLRIGNTVITFAPASPGGMSCADSSGTERARGASRTRIPDRQALHKALQQVMGIATESSSHEMNGGRIQQEPERLLASPENLEPIQLWEADLKPEIENILQAESARIEKARQDAEPRLCALMQRAAEVRQRIEEEMGSLADLTAEQSEDLRVQAKANREPTLRALPTAVAEAQAALRSVDPLTPLSMREFRCLMTLDDELLKRDLFDGRVLATLERGAALERRAWMP